MFDKEFYPTNRETLQMMPIDCAEKTVLEPQAGKGDIVDYLYENGAKKVIAVEKNDNLRKIIEAKCQVIGSDFFDITKEQISHVQLIVMNPPFSNAEAHIMHAWEIAPEGCEIISLCNYETIAKESRYTRIYNTIKSYGIGTNLGPTFDTAERKTGIDIGMVRLFKPIISEGADFSGFFMEEEPESDNDQEGMMPFNEITALVNRYVGAMKAFDKLKSIKEEIEYTTGILGVNDIEFSMGYNTKVTTKEDFSKHLQKKSWNHIITVTGMRKFATSLMMADINKFVENQEKIPFTVKNVKHMLDMIFQTRQQQLNKALVSAVDKFTEHIDENRYGVEGWKANKGHMLNKKIIVPNIFERGWDNADYVSVRHNAHYKEILDDLIKVMCMLTGTDYKEINGFRFNEEGKKICEPQGIYCFRPDDTKGRFKTGTWYDWGFFEFKCFYKGTMHLKFKSMETWARLNRAYGEIKGFVVPEKF